MSRQRRLAQLEQTAATRRNTAPLVAPDYGPVDALGWPITPAGWDTLVKWAVTLTAGNDDMLNRLRVAYGNG